MATKSSISAGIPLRKEIVRSQNRMFWGLLIAIRSEEWVKNSFAYAPLLFSGRFFSLPAQVHALGAIVALCLAASAGYLVNDVRDRFADLEHPAKSIRPIASGVVPPRLAVWFATALASIGTSIGFEVNRATGWTILVYLGLAILYSLWLKRIVILDVLALASGFVLRVIAGAVAIQVEFSSWLLLCTFLLALFLGFSKRRNELGLLNHNAQNHRQVLDQYSRYFLDLMMIVVTSATVMSYALYTMDPRTVARFGTPKLIYSTVFVLYGIFRFMYLVYRRSEGGSPTRLLYTDAPLQLAILLWIASIFFLRYL
ncbi:MAG TPA: decaprenyl-phosphate phosphoribosyltransferase [Candidatus Acidoferrales bacterium]|nr:decaprenyl-phosphate phosphoribosyltransferase [Candidatus Acidoferrales bacterium]